MPTVTWFAMPVEPDQAHPYGSIVVCRNKPTKGNALFNFDQHKSTGFDVTTLLLKRLHADGKGVRDTHPKTGAGLPTPFTRVQLRVERFSCRDGNRYLESEGTQAGIAKMYSDAAAGDFPASVAGRGAARLTAKLRDYPYDDYAGDTNGPQVCLSLSLPSPLCSPVSTARLSQLTRYGTHPVTRRCPFLHQGVRRGQTERHLPFRHRGRPLRASRAAVPGVPHDLVYSKD